MKHIIEVNGIEIYAFHGHMPEEQVVGGKYTVDISITTDFSASFASDELEDTVDYVAIYDIVKKEMKTPSKLIEHVAHRIGKSLKDEIKGIKSTVVKVTKHNPPIGGNVSDVSVIVEG